VARSSGSIYSPDNPSIIEFDDGYWASVVFEGEYTVISTDIPPIGCGSGGGCYLEVLELGVEELERISRALGERVGRALLICTRVLDRCSGINLKIFLPIGVERAVEAFRRARGEVFRALAEIYGQAGS